MKKIWRSIITVLLFAMLLGCSMTTYAAPRTMADGTVFDAEFYAATYPDVKNELGTDEAVLYQHYMNYGKAEGRKSYAGAAAASTPAANAAAQDAFDAAYYAANNPDVVNAVGNNAAALYQHYVNFGKAEGRRPNAGAVIQNTSAKAVTAQFLASENTKHNYYGRTISAEGQAAAEAVARQIAQNIMANQNYTTDLQRVTAAAKSVYNYCGGCVYGSDYNKWYRSPYGVFVGGVYTCAGSSRALGRVLNYMGYEWTHTNENQNRHQRCIVTMDGKTGYADGMGGFAGYGTMKSGMTLPDGRIIYFPE